MGSFFTVLKFHLKENLTSKSFTISCLIILTFVIGFFGLNHFTSDSDRTDYVYWNTSDNIEITTKDFNKSQETVNLIQPKSLKDAKDQVQNGKVDGLFIVSDIGNRVSIEHHYKGMPNTEITLVFENFIYEKHLKNITDKEKVDSSLITEILTKPHITHVSVSEQEKNVGVVYFFIFMLYIFIIMFGQTLANGIVSEKTTRVMEMMLPKVKPIKMMYAKIFAVLLTGVIQILLFPLGLFIAYLIGWTSMDSLIFFGMDIDISTLTLPIFGLFVLYFTLGFLFYALIFAALGSAVNRSEDLQGLLTPMMIMIIGSFFIGLKALIEPSSTLVVVASYVPFSSPIVSFARIVLGEATWPESISSLAILIISIGLLSLLASRIYKNGVMKYSSKVSFKDIYKMLKK